MSSHSTAAMRLDVGVDQVGEAQQVGKAALGAERRPAVERRSGGVDRHRGLLCPAGGDLGDRTAVDRADVGEAFAGGNALAADEVVGRDGDAGDLGDVCVCGGGAHSSISVSRSSTE